MALTAPSSTLTGQTIAASYDQVLFLDAAAGVTEATLKIVSGTAGKTALSISDEHVLVKGVDTNNAAGFEVQQTDGTSILKVAADTPAATLVGALTVTGNTTMTTADNTDTLSLISTDTDANAGPNLRLYRNTASPGNWDINGEIDFIGKNDAVSAEDIQYGTIRVFSADFTDGEEDGDLQIRTMKAGTSSSRIEIAPDSTVINEESLDVDFRVESNGNANRFFINGGDDTVLFGTTTSQTTGDKFAVQIFGTTQAEAGLAITRNSANSGYPNLAFGKSRHATPGSFAKVIDNDILGVISFWGDDDSDMNSLGASILARIDGTPSDNVMPTELVFGTNTGAADVVEQMVIHEGGDITVSTGNLIIGTAGKGIDFSNAADTATGETVTSSLLDDYEEGTFDFAATSASGTIGINTDYNQASYVKIGSIVHFQARLHNNTFSGGDGAVTFTGLPFTSVASLTEQDDQCPVLILIGNTSANGAYAGLINEGVTTIIAGLIDADTWDNDVDINLQGTYRVA